MVSNYRRTQVHYVRGRKPKGSHVHLPRPCAQLRRRSRPLSHSSSLQNTQNTTAAKPKAYHKVQRQAVASMYEAKFYRRPDIPMFGRGSAAAAITRALGVHNTVVAKVVKQCKEKLDKKETYNPNVTYGRCTERKVKPESIQEHLVSVYCERHSASTTADMMSSLRKLDLGEDYEEAKHSIGEKAVRNALSHMSFQTLKVKKTPQQSNQNPIWVKARYDLSAQMLVRFGLDLPDSVKNDPNLDRKFIDPARIKAEGLELSIYQIAWWDELHIKQRIGEQADWVSVFARDEKGVYNKNGEIKKYKPINMVPKFPEEGRFAAGVAAVLKNDEEGNETEEGIRLEPFIYTGKKLATIAKWEGLIEQEIKRVRNLPSDTKRGGWTTSERPPKRYWHNDPVRMLPTVGKATEQSLKSIDISLIGHLTTIQDTDISELATKSSLTTKKIATLRSKAVELSSPGDCPYEITDHRKTANPYASRYGESWEEEIKKSVTLSRYASIKDLVTHIHNESRRAMQGTKYEGRYYFYHDALTQLTDTKCVEWMKKQDIYKHWIKPELGCNENITVENEDGETVKSKRYANRMVGNSPEMNPLDNTNFRDVRTSIALNVAATWHLDKKDPLKFSLCTPKEVTRAFTRIWDPKNGVSPSSRRVLEDVKRVLTSLEEIAKAKGKIVPGIVNRNGHRAPRSKSAGAQIHGCKKKQKSLEDIGIHESVRNTVQGQYKSHKELFENQNKEKQD